MTRTFCLGEPPEELVRYHALVREALDLAYATIRPGIAGAEAHRVVCELFEAQGYVTQLSKEPGQVLEEGFFHSLGHGVGLEVHELPALGQGRRGDRRRRRARGRARPLPEGLRRLPARGPRPRHRGRLRGADGLPVRARALAEGACQPLAGPSTLGGGYEGTLAHRGPARGCGGCADRGGGPHRGRAAGRRERRAGAAGAVHAGRRHQRLRHRRPPPADRRTSAWLSEANGGNLQAVIEVELGNWDAEHDDPEIVAGYVFLFTKNGVDEVRPAVGRRGLQRRRTTTARTRSPTHSPSRRG